jgi:hypothetical protein
MVTATLANRNCLSGDVGALIADAQNEPAETARREKERIGRKSKFAFGTKWT